MNPNTNVETPDPGKHPNRKIDLAFEEVARLSGADMPPSDFFQDFLKRVIEGIDAAAGAIWLKNPQGFLQLQCQVNIDGVGLDNHKNGRQSHNELLRQAFQTAKPILLEPFGSTGILEGIPAGNPTEMVVLLAPVIQDEKTAVGLVEVWQDPRWDARAKRVHLQYLIQMAGYASTYFRTQQGRQTVNLEQFWTQLEAFSCQLHSTLDTTTVAYHVANEGRRLVACDRISVAVREGRKAKIEAVSGSDVVEKRATQVKLMRKLADGVFKWDEKLIYKGVKDDGLPPDVYEALDAYLAESHAKLLVFQPLHDPREKDKETKELKPGKARSALLMECYEPPTQPEPLIARLDVIGRHAASALYNAMEMRKIPLAFMWKPVLKVQEGLGGRTRMYTILGTTVATLLILAMIFVPYELKIDAKGQLMPIERRTIFSPRPGTLERFYVEPKSEVPTNGVLAMVFDPDLMQKIQELNNDIHRLDAIIRGQENQMGRLANSLESERIAIGQGADSLSANRIKFKQANDELEALNKTYKTDEQRPGAFFLRAPEFRANARRLRGDAKWIVISGNDFRADLQGKKVTPNEPLMRLGDRNGEWEIEAKIPQTGIGQVMDAFKTDSPEEEIDVDLKPKSKVIHTYKGKLARRKISPEAIPNKDDHNETEPVFYCYIRIRGEGIAPEDEIPEELYLTGVDVTTKVRCGKHALGYSLFYGVYEFACEKLFQLGL